ncbi:Anhydro-N-acetylmuramic acid kinase [Halomonadaceae bacterium LMG 33818]|uniref:anhydro-N-acetylmuramic acid kinase n=1 Tax=Cernens ardua TaxID=3402176 RepID=UPI003EDC8D0C
MNKWSIGLMTGTVLDGFIDIAAIRSNGVTIDEFGPYELVAYPDDIRPLLVEAMDAARAWNFEGPEPAIFREAETRLSKAQAEAVAHFLEQQGISPSEVEVIGFHGQTVLHAAPTPERKGATRQLGDGQLMADHLGIDVVYDFRSADVENGGQGAPLAAVYHQALLRSLPRKAHWAILNLGGVGNISAVEGDTLIAFDTGPANAPINDWIYQHSGKIMDKDGVLAANGQVDEPRLERLLRHPYFTAPYPKSLDRFDFMASMADGLNEADGAATLTAFTAGAVAKGIALLSERPEGLIVCGGGRRNPTLMKEIAQRCQLDVIPAEEVGLRGDAVEAECFAFLAERTLHDLPLSFPGTTGVAAPQRGGRIARARKL